MREAMKSLQVVLRLRVGAGGIPHPRRMFPTVWSETLWPRLAKGTDDAVVSPAGVLSGEADNERFEFWRDAGPAGRSTKFGTVKFCGSDLFKRSPAEPLANFSEGRSLGIRKADTGGQVGAEDAILGCEVFILEQEVLIDASGHVRQEASPFVVWHQEHPS
jgi:hypothetical protein